MEDTKEGESLSVSEGPNVCIFLAEKGVVVYSLPLTAAPNLPCTSHQAVVDAAVASPLALAMCAPVGCSSLRFRATAEEYR